MEIGQRLAIVEPADFRHEALDQLQHAVGTIDETAQQFPRVDAGLRAALIEPAFDARRVLGRRQPDEGHEIAALEMGARLLKGILPFEIDQSRGGIGEHTVRIGLRGRSAVLRRKSPNPNQGGATHC